MASPPNSITDLETTNVLEFYQPLQEIPITQSKDQSVSISEASNKDIYIYICIAAEEEEPAGFGTFKNYLILFLRTYLAHK